MDLVLDCIKVVDIVADRPDSHLRWWALENPKGRMRRIIHERRGVDIGPFTYAFDPCEFAGWNPGGEDTYTKRTFLWGQFEKPEHRPLPITHKRGTSPIHRAAPGPDRWRLRSATPRGFANAFFAANP